ncbi:MAG: antibiotic biosynthesis monooxygenase family protein [Terriglobia bacterium]
MMLRTFTFRVPKKRERAMRAFMKREARRLLRRVPGCRAAYFLRNQARRNEYTWVTVWTSDAARERAMQRRDWKALVKREEQAGFFAGRPRRVHYDVVLTL